MPCPFGTCQLQSLAKLATLEVFNDFKCNKSKCEIWVEWKFVKHSYKSIERNSEPLDLIRNYISDMKSTPSHGGKKSL